MYCNHCGSKLAIGPMTAVNEYVKEVSNELNSRGYTIFNAGKEDKSSSGFLSGESWSDAGMAKAKKIKYYTGISKNGATVGYIIVIDEKIPGIQGEISIFITKNNKQTGYKIGSLTQGSKTVSRYLDSIPGIINSFEEMILEKNASLDKQAKIVDEDFFKLLEQELKKAKDAFIRDNNFKKTVTFLETLHNDISTIIDELNKTPQPEIPEVSKAPEIPKEEPSKEEPSKEEPLMPEEEEEEKPKDTEEEIKEILEEK